MRSGLIRPRDTGRESASDEKLALVGVPSESLKILLFKSNTGLRMSGTICSVLISRLSEPATLLDMGKSEVNKKEGYIEVCNAERERSPPKILACMTLSLYSSYSSVYCFSPPEHLRKSCV